ncbi:acetyl-CoA synthetase-like protein, partial [Aspergillus ruber CBS 135680]
MARDSSSHAVITEFPVRVIKPDRGSELIDIAKGAMEIGEITPQRNLYAKEYYRDPGATEKLFAGGWIHMGDLAGWHPDGAIQILNRAKDTVNSDGEIISSVAVESILIKHLSIIEAAVIGVPDKGWGGTPMVFITTTPGSIVMDLDVITWTRESSDIGRFRVPQEVHIVQELPKTSTGKMQEKVLREQEEKRRKR